MGFKFLRLSIGFLAACGFALPASAADWNKLGERRVSDRADHDPILVRGERGMSSAPRIHVREHPVGFYKVVVHDRIGGSERLELRDGIRAGGASRVLDLRGGKRVIRTTEFRYEAKSVGRDGAWVSVWGRR